MKIDFKTPPEEQWAESFYKEKILPDYNPVFAKRLFKRFIEKPLRRPVLESPFGNAIIRYAAQRNHRIKTKPLLKAFKSLKQLDGETVHLIFYDDQTAASIERAVKHLNEAKRILGEVLQEYKNTTTQTRKDSPRLLAKMIWDLMEEVKRENKRRRTNKPRLKPYRKEWELVVHLLGVFCGNTGDVQIFTSSVEAVRRLAYRYKPRSRKTKSR